MHSMTIFLQNYNLQCRVYDGYISSYYWVNITVDDTNLRPPVFSGLDYESVDIVEHSSVAQSTFMVQVNHLLCTFFHNLNLYS